MSDISTDDIKQLREETGISVAKCKKALEAVDGDLEKARGELKANSEAAAAKKADREVGAGVIASYVHSDNSVATMVSLACETDFVAKNDEYKELAYNIAMHIAAMNPTVVSEDDAQSEEDIALMEQPFVKNPEKTIADLVNEATQKFGEKITVHEFERMEAVGN